MDTQSEDRLIEISSGGEYDQRSPFYGWKQRDRDSNAS